MTSNTRRQFLQTTGTAALAAGTVPLVTAGPAAAAPNRLRFGPVRQLHAGVLNVGYVELGPSDGRPVVLMHGFPYDIHSYEEVAPLLAARGYRVIVPYFRGYGSTTFRSAATPRDVDQAAFALDILALMDALRIRRAVLAGYSRPTGTTSVSSSGSSTRRPGPSPARPTTARPPPSTTPTTCPL